MNRKYQAGVIFLGLVWPWLSAASADVRRERTLRRPYVTEIGQPYSVSNETLRTEAQKNSELQEYLVDYGTPDYVEIQEISPEWPWESYETRLFYLRRNVEVDFGHVLAIDTPSANLGMMKFQGGIPAQKRHEIEVVMQAQQNQQPVAPSRPLGAVEKQPRESNLNTLVARIEAAAERAAQAADRAVEQSEAAERAANRTVSVVEKMSKGGR